MTATPDFSIRMQVAGMSGLLSEIIAVGALSKHGDTDLMERVREAADTPLPELPTRSCLAQIEEPAGAAPAAVAGPAWDKTRDSLATLLLGLARRPFLDLDVACIALDAATEPGMPLAYMRHAPVAPALEAPAALEVIDIGDDGQLRMDPNMPGAWQLFRRNSHIRYLDKFERNFVNSALRAALTETARAPAGLQAAPVAGQSRFAGETTWGSCTVEHVDMVLAAPTLWGRYEVRYLYAAPQAPAAPAVDAKTAYAPIAPVQIVWHDSPEAVDAAHWKPLCDDEGITLEELQSGVAVGSDSNGEEVEMTHEQMIQSMRDMGFWGFVDTKTRTIHAWADPATPDNAIMEFLGHEIGHVTGIPDARDWEEEMRADQYGGLVKMAHSLLLTRPAAPAAPAVDADGARYRYLRDEHIGDDPESINLPPGKKRGLDSAVDAAIAAQAKEGGAR